MKILKTKFKGLLVVKGKRYNDSRGFFREVVRENILNQNFPFQITSSSKKNVIRGLHFQKKNSQGKYVTVIKGKIIDVVVDLRKKSKTYGKHFKIVLSDKNAISIFIPKGFAHGFGGLDKENIVHYSCTNYRHKQTESGIIWNDKDLKISWGIKKPIISEKDKNNFTFKSFE
jgi:dTDP-4-dehydrorhamnose 3,5-epimerase